MSCSQAIGRRSRRRRIGGIWKQLANRIAKVAKTEGTGGWSFAAEPAIHKAIAELLPVSIRERIVERVPSDLMKIEPAKLPSHFRSLRLRRAADIAKREAEAPRKKTTGA
jgi:hypothetical protein